MLAKLRKPDVSPRHQIWLLFGAVVITFVVVIGGMFVVLGPARAGLNDLDTKLVPAITHLDEASSKYSQARQILRQAALEVAPEARNASFETLAALNAAGAAAWKAYMSTQQGLLGEEALIDSFKADRMLALASGVAFLTDGPTVSVAQLADVAHLSDVMLSDLDDIKALYSSKSQRTLSDTRDTMSDATRDTLLLAVFAWIILSSVFGIAARAARGREIKLEQLNRVLAKDSDRNELEARLQRSLEMVRSEEGSYQLVHRTLSKSLPGLAAELLLADSSRAHFRQVTATPELGTGGCAVMSPLECPAASRGQTQVWTSSSDIDACPYLLGRVEGACSAACVPLSIAGNTVGVVHATADDGAPPDHDAIDSIELISLKVGERIGLLRAFSKSEVQAHTDPLTGLMNRRSLEVAVHALAEDQRPYVVAYGDLDHFKQLNDVYGHDAGDRALRLFARVVRDALRPNDIPARYGGEEFVMVIPECSVPDAVSIIDRLREQLAAAQQGGAVPPFTVSFGVASAQFGVPFNDTVELADAALLQAKAEGRDRVVIAAPDRRAPDPTDAVANREPRLVA